MANETNIPADWRPVAELESDTIQEGGSAVLRCSVEGADPSLFHYRYLWMSEQGDEGDSNGKPKPDDRVFVFWAPHRGRFLLTAEVFAPDGTAFGNCSFVTGTRERISSAHSFLRMSKSIVRAASE